MTLEYMPASTLLHPLDTRELRVYTGHKIYVCWCEAHYKVYSHAYIVKAKERAGSIY